MKHPTLNAIYDYLESGKKNLKIRSHLDQCPQCAEKAQTMKLVTWVHDNWTRLAPRRAQRR